LADRSVVTASEAKQSMGLPGCGLLRGLASGNDALDAP
jgi:hypothetical protein